MLEGIGRAKKSEAVRPMTNDNMEVCSIFTGIFEQTLPHFIIAYSNSLELHDLQIAVCNNCGIAVAFP